MINLSVNELPPHCDVLVIGAGPAGSAAAIVLAREGLSVVLVDQQRFPRDKVCGDGLIPDAHRALRTLGVFDEVMAQARHCPQVVCTGPRGGQIEVPGSLAVLPRKQLDWILARAAVAAGARLFAPVRFVATIEADGAVIGATLSHGEQNREVRARWVFLATGAVPTALIAAGMCTRQTPSAVALRGYVKHEALAAQVKPLHIVWHSALRGGYGWVFPGPAGVFNLGVCATDSHDQRNGSKLAKRPLNLHHLMERFVQVNPLARELMQSGTVVGAMKGAPLRTSLDGARHSRPGLLVIGEAAGATYSFTGEGIGKAMETAINAAHAVLQETGQATTSGEPVRAAHEASLQALKPRFALYERANLVNHHPWLTDLVIWRARRSPRLVQRMTGLLEETSNPGRLFTAKGVWRLLRG